LTDLTSRFEEYRQRVEELTEVYLRQRKNLDEKESEISELREDLRRAEAEISRLRQDVEYLKVSHRIASGPDDLIKSRRMIAGLIRGIDRCIAGLKE